MKNKVFKISVVILLIMTLTMTNFIFLGSSLISYAADSTSTNHKNIEFDAYFKDSNGKKTTTLERTADMQEVSMYLAINVNTEGFFVGQVALQNSNFSIVGSESEFVSKISDNTIYLNQLDVGTTAEIEVKVKPVDNEVMNIDMLDCQSEVTLTGVYRDNTEKEEDIQVSETSVAIRIPAESIFHGTGNGREPHQGCYQGAEIEERPERKPDHRQSAGNAKHHVDPDHHFKVLLDKQPF